jgi:short-subunit dehydrogenase
MAEVTADKFASKGYDVQLAARNMERLEPLRSDLGIRYNVICTRHEFDATEFEQHQQLWDSLTVKPDVTIYFSGYLNDNDKVTASLAETLKTIATNFTGAVSILNIVAADYIQRKQGAIVGISSVAGMRGRQSNYVYGSAKAGFTAYLSGLRNRLYHSNVHVMAVLPGFVYTKMTETRKLPKLVTAQPEEVANAIYKGVLKKKNKIFVKWFWRYIMFIITSIPEPIFKKLKL